MDLEIVKFLAPLGVGGILAALIFYFYRRDFILERGRADLRETRLLDVLERTAVASERLAASTDNLTAIIKERLLAGSMR